MTHRRRTQDDDNHHPRDLPFGAVASSSTDEENLSSATRLVPRQMTHRRRNMHNDDDYHPRDFTFSTAAEENINLRERTLNVPVAQSTPPSYRSVSGSLRRNWGKTTERICTYSWFMDANYDYFQLGDCTSDSIWETSLQSYSLFAFPYLSYLKLKDWKDALKKTLSSCCHSSCVTWQTLNLNLKNIISMKEMWNDQWNCNWIGTDHEQLLRFSREAFYY